MSAAPRLVAPAAPAAGRGARVLSPSQVNTFLDCQARWYYSHELELPEPATGSQALGRAVHYTAGMVFFARSEGSPLTEQEVEEMFRWVFSVELRGAELREDEEAGALADSGVALVAMFAREIAPSIEPAAVEPEVHGSIGGQHVRGFVDILTADGVVIDLKTATKKPGFISSSYELQLATYAELCGKKTARLVTLARTLKPSWAQHTLSVTEKHSRYLAGMYSLAAEAMNSGLYVPNRGSNLCSRKHCAFWRACEAEYGGCVR